MWLLWYHKLLLFYLYLILYALPSFLLSLLCQHLLYLISWEGSVGNWSLLWICCKIFRLNRNWFILQTNMLFFWNGSCLDEIFVFGGETHVARFHIGYCLVKWFLFRIEIQVCTLIFNILVRQFNLIFLLKFFFDRASQ